MKATVVRWAILMMSFAPAVSAQRVVQGGPPPEMRALLDSIVAAVNSGSADAWESFVQARFTTPLQQKTTPQQRAEMYRKLVDDLGTIAIGGVRREGPEAPLQITTKGSKSTGVFIVDVDERSAPFKIANFGIDSGNRGPATPVAGVPLPVVDRTLAADEIERRLDSYFSKLSADDVFSGAALVAKNGVPVFMKAYGMADREKKIPNTIRTRFNLGSINKEFTQTAIRQLVREGKLSPDDTIGKFFPDYPQATSRSATVQQLLTHRGGLSDFFGPKFNETPKDRFASNADYFKFVSNLSPTFAPGERNQYCNGCYIALGAIVEKVSGMPYEKYVAQNVFGRAEMTSTGYPRSDQPAPDIALGYMRRASGQDLKTSRPQDLKTSGPQDLVLATSMHGVTGSAAGGGYSTVLDLLTYVKAVRAGKFPGNDAEFGIAGGAPGINGTVETRGEWTVIVLANFDPPVAERIGVALADSFQR